ncbi:hypothetical protein BDZ89DRAFT_1220757 [Hymenopellis radicata]|nr:hypothetical protein BDZ89DRAFT_1220757 [Hymenopellis radicata]
MATTRSSTSGRKEHPYKRPADSDASAGRTESIESPTKKTKPSPHSDADTASSDGNSTILPTTASRLTADMESKLASMRAGGQTPTTTAMTLVEPLSRTPPPFPSRLSLLPFRWTTCLEPRPSGFKQTETQKVKGRPSRKDTIWISAQQLRLDTPFSQVGDSGTEPLESEALHISPDKSAEVKEDKAEATRSEFKPPNVTVLARVPETGLQYTRGSNREVCLPWCKLRDYLGNAPEFVERILNISSYAVGNNMFPMFGVEPREFHNTVGTVGFKNRHVYSGSRGRKVPDATFIIIRDGHEYRV